MRPYQGSWASAGNHWQPRAPLPSGNLCTRATCLMSQSWPSISRGSKTTRIHNRRSLEEFLRWVCPSIAPQFPRAYYMSHGRHDQYVSLYGPNRLSICSFRSSFILDPSPHEPNCKFGLCNTALRLFLVLCDRHGNNTYWRSCRASQCPVCADSQICRWHRQLRRVLHLSYVVTSPPPGAKLILGC
jgi:hypothetical protein